MLFRSRESPHEPVSECPVLTLLSPAKSLNFDFEANGLPVTPPRFQDDAAELLSTCRKLSVAQLRKLMGISQSLAELNHARFQAMEIPFVYIGMAIVEAPSQFWTLFIAYGFYYGMTEGAEKALVADFVPSQFRGTAYGIYHGAVGLAALPASLIFGVFWKVIGPARAFAIGASLAGVAAVLLIGLLSTTRGGLTRQEA